MHVCYTFIASGEDYCALSASDYDPRKALLEFLNARATSDRDVRRVRKKWKVAGLSADIDTFSFSTRADMQSAIAMASTLDLSFYDYDFSKHTNVWYIPLEDYELSPSEVDHILSYKDTAKED